MDITPTASVLNSTGEVFELYGEHFGAGTQPVSVQGNSPQPEPKHPVGFAHPKVRAGSPTYPLDVIAGLSPERDTLRIAVVNATLQPQTLAISLNGVKIRGSGKVWRLTGESVEAANKVGQPPGVTIRESRMQPPSPTLKQPPISVSVYEFPVVDSGTSLSN